MTERTLSIIKPDACSRHLVGEILRRFEQEKFKILAIKRLRLSKKQAEKFYEVHRERPFYDSLTTFMALGPVVVIILEGDGVIKKYRDLMGPTDPAEAPAGTIRGDYGKDIENNAVHGSDSPENADPEIAYFFSGLEIVE